MLPIYGDGEKGVKILFGDRYLDRLLVKVEKKKHSRSILFCLIKEELRRYWSYERHLFRIYRIENHQHTNPV